MTEKNFFAVRVKSNSIRRALRTPRLKAEGSSVYLALLPPALVSDTAPANTASPRDWLGPLKPDPVFCKSRRCPKN